MTRYEPWGANGGGTITPWSGPTSEQKTPIEKLRELGFDLPNEFAAFPGILLDEVAVTWTSKEVTMCWPITVCATACILP